jgi:hypothetical protein
MGLTVPSDRAWKVMFAITCQEPANAYLFFVKAIELNVLSEQPLLNVPAPTLTLILKVVIPTRHLD